MKFRRFIESIKIEGAREVVPIDFLLPWDAVRCTGIQAIIHGLFPSSRSHIPNFGEYSLEFGGKSLHPLHSPIHYTNPSLLSQEVYFRPGILPLDVAISDNKLVTGYYRDLDEQSHDRNDHFTPYQVKLIFHLELS
jgi:hypothetical protein